MAELIRHRDTRTEQAICEPEGSVIRVGAHPYVLHPFQAVRPQDPNLMVHVARMVLDHPKFNHDFDNVFALAQKSIPFAAHFSVQSNRPLSVAYMRGYEGLTPEMAQTELRITEQKRYADPLVLYSYFLKAGCRVTFVDDDINWGDAAAATAQLFAQRGLEIPNYVIGVEKVGRGGVYKLMEELGKHSLFNNTLVHICSSIEIGGDRVTPAREVNY